MKYQIVVVDPPWSFSDSLKMSITKRGAISNYNTLSIQDIKSLPVKDIADPTGAVLALWVPSSLLQDGMDIMKEWGFKQKQTYIWVKVKKDPYENIKEFIKSILPITKNDIKNILGDIALEGILQFGMGRLFRQTHEICLIGINNNDIYKKLKNRSQRSVSFGENLKHSKKPEALQNSLEVMFDGDGINKIELFARRERENWLCLGNEIGEKKDIRESLKELIEG